MSFAFGTPKTTGGFTAGSATVTQGTAAGPSAFSVGGGTGDAKTNLLMGFTPTSTGAAPQPKSSVFTLSTPTTLSTGGGFSLNTSTTPTVTTATTGFSLGSGTSTGFGLSTGASGAFSLSSSSASATPQTSAPTLKLGQTTVSTSSTQPITSSAVAATPSLGASTVVTSSTVSSLTTPMHYVQLEETINKWTLDLEEQEKIFIGQAAEINAWDQLFSSNSEKIISVNNEVENMKLQQLQLDHELDFILAQQRELEECLVPLEKELESTPTNTDPEREHTYHLAEHLDTQLKQMSEDLKEIIEHLNESSRTQDTSDPIVQIGRILNAHMNSLQWIDQNIVNIQTQLDNVTKMHDTRRRENERSFRLSYD